jgi:hypothetical protein
LIEENGQVNGAELLMDELWAVLHGMATLHLDLPLNSMLGTHKIA